jgi:hypothetical protein
MLAIVFFEESTGLFLEIQDRYARKKSFLRAIANYCK